MNNPTADDLAFVRKLVREQAGMVLTEDKAYLIDSKLRSLARRERFSNLTELVKQLRAPASATLRKAMVEEILVGETYFFRDGHPFDALRHTVLPTLVRECVGDKRLNLWCAATSTGQEPYSLAILLSETLRELPQGSVSLLATDLSDANLSRARAGLYTDLEITRGMDDNLRAKYFRREPDGWLIHESLRRRIDFVRLNLIVEWPVLPPMDLVLMRNVLVYFDATTRTAIMRKLRDAIRPGGYLLLGTSESQIDAPSGFTQIRLGSTILYRRDRDKTTDAH